MNRREGAEPQRDAAAPVLERLLVRSGDRRVLVRLVDIDWIGGAGNYVRLHIGPCAHRYRETLRNLERQLDPRRFVRIHRSTIVNIDRISELRPTESGCYDVALLDGSHLSMSRRHRARLLALVGRI